MTTDELIQEMMQHTLAMEKLFVQYLSKVNHNQWLCLSEAIDISGLTADQIRYRAKQGQIQSEKKGNTILYLETDLEKFAPRMRAR